MYKRILSLIIIFTVLLTGFFFLFGKTRHAAKTEDQCYNCHLSLDGKNLAPAKAFSQDIHFKKGIKCAGCHGGDASSDDMDQAMNKDKGFIGIPKSQDRFKVCIK